MWEVEERNRDGAPWEGLSSMAERRKWGSRCRLLLEAGCGSPPHCMEATYSRSGWDKPLENSLYAPDEAGEKFMKATAGIQMKSSSSASSLCRAKPVLIPMHPDVRVHEV
ncbi:hypothetical protein C8Q74DRAFT_933798 [Fomes fomentarius]|nr:hypothetical protein C8Q74DRAFT_933798 [Fomes fomentarius]